MGYIILFLGELLILSKVFTSLWGSLVLELCNRNMDQLECEERVENYIRNHEKLFHGLSWLGWAVVLVGAIVQCGWIGIFFPGALWLTAWIVDKVRRTIETHQKSKRKTRYRCANDCQIKNAASWPVDYAIQFLTKHPVEWNGKTYDIKTIWNYTDAELERKHDYIQWLFPTDEPSAYNHNAPILTAASIQLIRENSRCRVNIMKSLDRMLDFYGFGFDPKTMKIHQMRPEKWPPTPHNFLRITRILKCLNLCGIENVAKAFYNALMSIPNLKETVPKTSFDYWKAAAFPTKPNIATQPFIIKSDLKLLIISDCHSLTEDEAAKLAGLEYDLCFLLGDINEKYLKMILKYVPIEKTFGIHGNHDEYGLLEFLNIPNIHLKTINHRGVTILGYEGGPRYKRSTYVMHTQEESLQDLKQAPPADVLVSHDGPYMLYSESLPHSGFLGIAEYLADHTVPLNIHGHQHINSRKQHGTTDIICVYRASLVDLAQYTIENIF